MHNIYILFLQILLCCIFNLVALRSGEKVLNSWLCFIAVAMNIFVMKQITLFGLNVTATDALTISYLIGLNLLQEYFGRKSAKQHAYIAVLICMGFVFLSDLHNFYLPNQFDMMHDSYLKIFKPLKRVILSSIFTLFLIQFLDISLFQYLRKKLNGKLFSLRILVCLVISQLIDTLLFSFLGLYGLVNNLSHIILVSLLIKFIVILISVPFTSFCKKFIKQNLDLNYGQSKSIY